MHIVTVKVKELNFELTYQDIEEQEPTLEIENDTSAILVKVEYEQAKELRELLNRFIDNVDSYRGRLDEKRPVDF